MIRITLPQTNKVVKSNKTVNEISLESLDFEKAKINGIKDVLFNNYFTNLIHCPSTLVGIYSIPDTVETIGIEAFSQCKGLTSVYIPSSVKTIGCLAFSHCVSLTTITLPSSIEEMGYRALSNCIGLKSIFLKSETPLNLIPDMEVFHKINKESCALYVPIGSKSAYQNATQWNEFQIIVELPVQYNIMSLLKRKYLNNSCPQGYVV